MQIFPINKQHVLTIEPKSICRIDPAERHTNLKLPRSNDHSDLSSSKLLNWRLEGGVIQNVGAKSFAMGNPTMTKFDGNASQAKNEIKNTHRLLRT
jgi:hypothetical protein